MARGVIDLFCGAGGASLGLELAGFEVLGAVDNDADMCEVYASNLGLEPLCGDLTELSYDDVLEHFDVSRSEVDVVVGCPPCQNFSSLRRTRPWPEGVPKDELLHTFINRIEEGLPKVVVFENVPGIQESDRNYLDYFLSKMGELGYGTVSKLVNAADYGVPQLRKRVFAFCVHDVDSEELSMPEPTHAPPETAENNGKERWVTVRDAIGDLPSLERGEAHPEIPNHEAKRHREKTMRMIRNIPLDGGSRRDLPRDLWLPCHKKLEGGGAENVYGRMRWDEPSTTMTTRCTTPSCGRFLHPEQHRGITPREAARIQTFPDWFEFPDYFSAAERAIGNAVPPQLFKVLVEGFFKEHRDIL